MSIEQYSDTELAGFRASQQLAYACAQETAAQLRGGMTEKDAAAELGLLLRQRGVDAFFHVPLAWFGDRTGFYGFRTPSYSRPWDMTVLTQRFMPSGRRLEEGMPVILDVAPVLNEYASDIGYAFSFGDNPTMDQARVDLQRFRTEILDWIRAGYTMAQVYQAVDSLLAELGYECSHRLYPSHVLAHKIGRIRPHRLLPVATVGGFDLRAITYFGRQLLGAVLPGENHTPLWNEDPLTAVTANPGLWAFEPHIRKDGVGAKWEEILVVPAQGEAHWLDDDLPHVRYDGGSAG